jgi:hypothetical protein
MKTKLIPLALIVMTIMSCVQLKSRPLSNVESQSNGFFYALPKTYLNAKFELKQTTIKEGPYFEYAKCFGIPEDEISNIVKAIEKGTKYSIESVTFSNNTYLDTSQIYQLDFNQRFLNKSEFALEYAKNGELVSADISSESQVLPALITTASIITKLSTGVSVLSATAIDSSTCSAEFIKTDIERLSSINTAITDLLVDGPDGLPQAQLEYRIKQLNKLKGDLIAKYTAIVKTKTIVQSFEIDPVQLDSIGSIDLFKFNKKNGFVRIYKTNLHNSDAPITEAMTFKNKKPDANPYETVTIHLVYVDKGIGGAISNKTTTPDEGSFFYRIPANASFKITKGPKTIGGAIVPVPQLGITVAAPKHLNKITFKLHPGLGSIHTVSGKSDSIRFGDIDSLSKVLLKNKDEETIKSLETQIKIKELREKLKDDTSSSIEDED